MSTPTRSHLPPYQVGPDEFETDAGRMQQALARYDEGKGLIHGDPRQRPRWLHPLPAEPAPAFRLHQSSPAHLQRLREFLGAAPLEVEIGSGRGEFILDWAARHPQRHFLAFEVRWKLLQRIARKLERAGLANLWLSDDDARYDLPRLLAPGSVAAFHILFPDPWWKPKHQPRRLFTPPFVEALALALQPGGLLRVATDVPGYGQQIAHLLHDHPHLRPAGPAATAPYATALPSSRQAFCDEHGRPYTFYHFTKL